jgi:serine/threonine-protein kinase
MPTGAASPDPRDAPASGSSRHPSSRQGGFAPGTMLADRFRIVGLLGRGGMGEVYRADDLKLGQPVALKFLPESLARDPAARERFHAEVRNARQIAHPNVCRVYDIGELDGLHFLSMEYVDGEDLASLLRRIGRLPPAKALEIARQLCAGLGAAHEKGVLHRDLKPANIMLDGHGRVRINDFGLAAQAHELEEGEISGTPAYMAPEQLEGKPASVQSDLYSLGLVLYEIYTGKRAFDATNFAEWRRAHTQQAPTPISKHAADVEDAVERAILRCLEKDPDRRPKSAMQLAASLPGGDPLAAALAAGETPSPEMVAAAGEEGALAPAKAWTLLAVTVVFTMAAFFLAPTSTIFGVAPIEKSPQFLSESAREISRKFGYADAPFDSAWWFDASVEYLDYQSRQKASTEWWPQLKNSEWTGIEFLYRESPGPLFPLTRFAFVDMSAPLHTVPKMITVRLDSRGRLLEFRALARNSDSNNPASEPDWGPAFAAAGLDPARFKKSAPAWVAPVPFDARVTWEGTSARSPDVPLEVQGAVYGGKLVYFEQRGAWMDRLPSLYPDAPRGVDVFSRPAATGGDRFLGLFVGACFLGGFVGAVFLARHNLRLGRGDRKGALRLALFMFIGYEAATLLNAHRTGLFWLEFGSLLEASAYGLLMGGLAWAFYMSVEPFFRRRWPLILTSWIRLLEGGFRNALVGRDVLIGVAVGALLVCLTRLVFSLPVWISIPRVIPQFASPEFPRNMVAGPAELMSYMIVVLLAATAWVMLSLALIVLFRVLLRKSWVALAVFWVFSAIAVLGPPGAGLPIIKVAAGAVIATVTLILLFRVGLLAMLAAQFVVTLLLIAPLTLDFSRWYAGHGLAAAALAVAIAVYGFRVSLAGKPMFGSATLDE